MLNVTQQNQHPGAIVCTGTFCWRLVPLEFVLSVSCSSMCRFCIVCWHDYWHSLMLSRLSCALQCCVLQKGFNTFTPVNTTDTYGFYSV